MSRKLLFIVSALILASCAKDYSKVIENPYYSWKTTSSLSLTLIEKTDSATVLSFDAQYIPHYWIRMAKETVLLAGGAEYALKGGEGIVPGEYLWMPDSGQASFKLFFEPVPGDVAKADMIEGQDSRAFNFYDIDLTGNKKKPSVKAPRRYPEVEFVSGQTTLTIDMSFLAGRLEPEINMWVNTMFPNEQLEFSGKPDADGKVTFSFWQNGPATAFFPDCIPLHLAAGETVSVSLEGSAWNGAPVWKGKYSDLYIPKRFGEFQINQEIATDAATGSEIMSILRKEYEDKVAAVRSSEMSAYEKGYILRSLRWQVCYMASSMTAMQRYFFKDAHGSLEGFVAPQYTSGDYEWMKELDLADPTLLLVDDGDLQMSSEAAGAIFGEEDNYITENLKAQPLMKKIIDGGTLSSEEILTAEGFRYPMFKDGIDHMAKVVEATFSKDIDSIKEAPKVSDSEVLDAILKSYSGKPVMVDIWATWCGPCRGAHKILEPLKDTDYKDVRFVYLTGPTSPRTKWLEMVPEIRGDHYYLTESQLNTVFNQLQSGGYPTYLIVGRDGKRVGKFIGYDADGIRSAIEKARK